MKIFMLILLVLGIFSLSIIGHEVWHTFQDYGERWEMCFTNNYDKYNTIAFVRHSGDIFKFATKEDMKHYEIAPTIFQFIIILFCFTYLYNNNETF